jgi:hypothetical protein
MKQKRKRGRDSTPKGAAAYPVRFKNIAGAEAYLSKVYALDGDRKTLVQRRRDAIATEEELKLLDAIALGNVKPTKVKIRKEMQLDHIAFEVLLAEARLRRDYPKRGGFRERAKDIVGKRFRVGHSTIDKALARFHGEKLEWAKGAIDRLLDLENQAWTAPDTIRVEDFDTDAITMIGPDLSAPKK